MPLAYTALRRTRNDMAPLPEHLAIAPGMTDYRRVMRKPLIDVVKVGKRGEVILPRRFRNSLDLQEGDELVLSVEDRRMVLERRARHFSAYLDVMANAPRGDEHEE